jgi:hypothetical protein
MSGAPSVGVEKGPTQDHYLRYAVVLYPGLVLQFIGYPPGLAEGSVRLDTDLHVPGNLKIKIPDCVLRLDDGSRIIIEILEFQSTARDADAWRFYLYALLAALKYLDEEKPVQVKLTCVYSYSIGERTPQGSYPSGEDTEKGLKLVVNQLFLRDLDVAATVVFVWREYEKIQEEKGPSAELPGWMIGMLLFVILGLRGEFKDVHLDLGKLPPETRGIVESYLTLGFEISKTPKYKHVFMLMVYAARTRGVFNAAMLGPYRKELKMVLNAEMKEFLDQVSDGEYMRAMNGLAAFETAKSQAEQFKSQAEQFKSQAEQFKSQAEQFKSQAEQFKSQLQLKDSEAEQFKSQLQLKDSEAEQFKSQAEQFKSQAEQFKSQLQLKDSKTAEMTRRLVLMLRRDNKSPEEICAEVNIDISEVTRILKGNGGGA